MSKRRRRRASLKRDYAHPGNFTPLVRFEDLGEVKKALKRARKAVR